MHESAIRKQMIEIGQLCYQRNLLVAMDGNLSARLSSGHILCTKAGCHKGFLTDDDLVVIDQNGTMLRGSGRPTSEMAMHLAVYRARPDISAVVHAHPPLSIAFTVAGQSLAQCVLPEVVLTLGVIPTIPYATTGTELLAQKVGEAIVNHDAILMDRHGAVCAGTNLLEAFCRLETMEHTALITKTARDMGMVRSLPPEEAVHLRSMGLKRYGGPPSAVAKADAPKADLPDACMSCTGCDHPKPTGIGPKADWSLARININPNPQTQENSQELIDVLTAATLRAMER
ncbi:MAG: class II aldolase/adducin family protein [Myxococcota bacterium]|nr:class II aldolase/adducin family protein [Myxococcota bacterium]MEC8379123.1 class II aldolase/adducin family protein [Myxococcota bacterium]